MLFRSTDAWIGWSLPIYYGDPTIINQVPNPNGVVLLDNIEDTGKAIESIERVMNNDIYDERLKAIAECREWSIKNSNPFIKATDIILSQPSYVKIADVFELINVRKEKIYLKSLIYSSASKLLGDKFVSNIYKKYRGY